MLKTKILLGSILEGIAYGLSGGIFVFAVLGIEDFLAKIDLPSTRFSIGSPEQSIGLGCLFLGLSISAAFGNLLFRKSNKCSLAKLLFILTISSITTVLIQMGILLYFSGQTFDEIISNNLPRLVWELLGFRWMIKLFVILAPFTILFTNRRLIIDSFRNRNFLR